jgi:hypothetical protein
MESKYTKLRSEKNVTEDSDKRTATHGNFFPANIRETGIVFPKTFNKPDQSRV